MSVEVVTPTREQQWQLATAHFHTGEGGGWPIRIAVAALSIDSDDRATSASLQARLHSGDSATHCSVELHACCITIAAQRVGWAAAVPSLARLELDTSTQIGGILLSLEHGT